MIKLRKISVVLFMVALGAPVLAAQSAKVAESKPGLLKQAKITADSAIAVAKATLPKATISSAEIEQENGKLVFSFDMKTAGKTGIDEVNVDALTGKVVGKVQHESAADEKKEADADAAKKAAKKPTP
jgi:DNA-directed RNA polymerase alpha subunit